MTCFNFLNRCRPSSDLLKTPNPATMSSEQVQQSNKPHRKSKENSSKDKSKHVKGNNPKAFTSQSGAKASRLARQNVEKDQKRLHVPAIDRTFGGYGAGQANSKSSVLGAGIGAKDDGPPPVIVAVMGPPGVDMQTSHFQCKFRVSNEL